MRHSPVLPPLFPGDLSILDELFDALPPEATEPAAGQAFSETLRDLLPVDLGGSDQFDFGALGLPEDVPPADAPDLPGVALALPDAASNAAAVAALDHRPVAVPPAFAMAPGFQDSASPITVTNDISSAKGGAPGKPTDGSGGDPGGDGTSGLLTSYLSGGSPSTDFNILINFKGTWTEALQKSFIDTAELISDIIIGDVADVRFRGKIDDITIDAELAQIDGTGGILGQAGVAAYRTDSMLPAYGFMQFDSADAEAFDAIYLFNDIVFHEMMHVIGFGTMWDEMGLVQSTADGLVFTGAQATAEFGAEFGVTEPAGVPVESEGGPGTAGGHWNEAGSDGFGFDNEIMTGFIDGSNYLSDTTIAALDDMGYETVYQPDYDVVANLTLIDAIFNDQMIA